MFKSIKFPLLVLFIIPLCSVYGEVNLKKGLSQYDMVPHLFYFIDDQGEMAFHDVLESHKQDLFIENRTDSLNFGFSQASYWVEFSLIGEGFSENGWLLELSYPAIDLYTLYLPDRQGGYELKVIGDSIPFDQWDVPYYKPTLILGDNLPLNQPIFLNVRTSAVVNIGATLWQAEYFYGHIASVKMLLGIYYGIMIAMIIYNLFFYLAMGDKNYLFYVMFIMVYTMSQLTYNGLGFRYMWPQANWFANFSYSFFLSVHFIPMILFAKSFLQTKIYLPRINYIFSGLVGFYIIISLSHSLLGMARTAKVSAVISLLSAGLILYSAVFTLLQGQRSAKFFLLAWASYLVGLVMLLLKMLGVFPHNPFTEYSIQVGSATGGLLLSLAITDRINILKKEKSLAQTRILEEIKRSEHLKSHYLEESEKLVFTRTAELQRAKNELEKLAHTDSLTRLNNRRVFDEMYEKEYGLSGRVLKSLSLIMIDVDHFKKYNDKYGHLRGDSCLQAISGCMMENARRISDTLARYGGEEFIIVMTDTAHDEALAIAELIRLSVMDLSIAHEDSPFGVVTISLGVATNNFEGETMTGKELLDRADNALYKAKDRGRNRTEYYPDAEVL